MTDTMPPLLAFLSAAAPGLTMAVIAVYYRRVQQRRAELERQSVELLERSREYARHTQSMIDRLMVPRYNDPAPQRTPPPKDPGPFVEWAAHASDDDLERHHAR